MLRRKVLRLATALGFVISSVAVAQDATTPPPAAPPPAAPPAAAPQSAVVGDQPAAAPAPKGDEERTEEIVVTGTRIKRKDLTTPAPVTVINRDQILASGKVSIGDFIQSLPEQGNGINTGVNNGGDGSTRVNLRGIGVPRTLVLVNGRRWVPGGLGADSSVDLNSIPSSTVERIEVLKDGGSALYGSDAIAGVVNIITKRSTNKTEATVLGGMSGQRDGQTLDLNLTTGTSSDRSSLLFSVGYFTQKKTMASDRSFSAIPRGYDGTVNQSYTAGSGTIPEGRTLVAGAGTTGNALWTNLVGAGGDSFIWDPGPAGPGYDASTVFCGVNGTGSNECFRKYAGAGLRDAGEIGDGYNFQPDNYLVTPNDRIQLFTTGDLKLADVVRGYFEASYMNRKSGQDLAPEPLNLDGEKIAVSAQNIYNPFGTDVFVRRRLSEFGRRTYTQDIDTFRVVTGLDGTLPEATGPAAGWFWDVNFNWGKTAAVQEKKGNLFTTPLAQSLGPSFRSSNGTDGIAGTADDVYSCGTAAAPIDGCVPLNLFGGPGSITQDQVKGLTFTGTSHGTNELWSVQANTSGELFKLLADRPVGLAAGYEHRDLSGTYVNDPITDKGLVTGNKTTDTGGSYYVDEIYGELSVPIVSNLPLAQDLEVTGAVRWFDYSTFGSDATYKIGGRWRPIGDVTVRGTYSTAFRAPSISELYLGKADNFPNVKDPCRGPAAGGQPLTPGTPLGDACLAQGVPAAGSGDPSAQLRSTNGGNADLKPETAKVYTVGLVIEPRWVRNLSVTLDYYNMDIDKNIGTVGTNVTLAGCYKGTNTGYCSNVIRSPATHYIDNIMDLNVNVGKMVTSGLDFAVRYALPTPGFGRFGAVLNANWLEKVNQTLADGRVVKGKGTFDLNSLQGNNGVGGTFPEWKFNLGVTWGMGGLGAGISTRYLGSFKECGDSTGDFSGAGLCYEDATYSRTVHSYHAEDAFVSYDLASRAGKTSFMVGVNNLSNAPPALIYNGFLAQTDPYNYDVMGRFFYIRLAQSY